MIYHLIKSIGPVLGGLLTDFVKSVGFQLIGDYLSNYLNNNEKMRPTADHMNQIMAKGGFTYTENQVFQARNIIFYPVGHKNKVDACLSFLDRESTKWVTMAEGPSIIGMGSGSKEIKNELIINLNQCPQEAEQLTQALFLPTKNLEHSQGNLYDGYRRRTRYQNPSGGEVIVDYNKI